ncbi:microfibrillar-associated protein 1 [Galendromus occidentalis]|uniref:Microfibrillar-associated protein 1 n=1 Tax=Galendromus occidentalis TaxID=34638 RepID=A0AAJ7L3S6_9ACAR|nr:microfibrillar-associated protein 1 [Galendromus occidentalis]
MDDVVHQNSLILSTAGAVPVVNEKGEVYMKKVKVQRYISGRRPKYAPDDSEESASSDDDFIVERQRPSRKIERPELRTGADQSGSEEDAEEGDELPQDDELSDRTAGQEIDDRDLDDPRLRRLMRRKQETRTIESATVVEGDDSDRETGRRRHRSSSPSSSSSDNEDLDDEERERKRLQIKQRALQRAKDQEEELVREVENKQDEEPQEDEESEYEEYIESEEEEQGPRLKPVFVRQRDRITIQEREQEEERKYRAELEKKKKAEEKRRQTLKIVESEVRKEVEETKEETKTGACVGNIEDVNTEDENDEAAYEAWKVRELKRIKRDREARDAIEREKMEVERLRNMTEEERLRELKNNPKKIVNKSTKGKYKYLQKYYHRGSYFVQDQEDDIYRRDFSVPTLEDHFNKSVLPKVMQVKNFGRSGRTKYTHLLDQDTTKADSPWSADTAQNLKWHIEKAGGSKASLGDRPSVRKPRN